MELIHFRYLSFVSANASEDNSQYKYCDGKSAEDIGGHKAEPGTKGFWAALFRFFFCKIAAIYPEKHDSCQAGAQWTDIDRNEVHPAGYDSLDAKAYCESQRRSNSDRYTAAQFKMLFQSGNRSFKQVDNG